MLSVVVGCCWMLLDVAESNQQQQQQQQERLVASIDASKHAMDKRLKELS